MSKILNYMKNQNRRFIMPIGVGSSESSGGDTEQKVYTCLSVDTTNKKWSGQKWQFNSADSCWQKTSTIDNTLQYTVITPASGLIYSADCLCRYASLYKGTKIPTDGLVVYAPFNSKVTTAQTGQTINLGTESNITAYPDGVDGIPCIYANQETISISDTTTTPEAVTVSLWVRFTSSYSTSDQGSKYVINLGSNYGIIKSTGNYGGWNGYIGGKIAGTDMSASLPSISTNTWYHCLLIFSNGASKFYLNGEEKQSSSQIFSTLTLGNYSFISHFKRYIAAFRVWNRLLDDEERANVYAQFNSEE